MKNKIFFFAFLAVATFGFWTCGDKDDKDGCSVAWASELTNEANAMINAAQVYAMDPTVANCNAYKAAAQDYLDALEPYGNCPALTGQSRTDWQNAFDQAQQDLNEVNCSGN